MGAREEGEDADALAADGRPGRVVGAVDAAEEGGEAVVSEAEGDGLELGGGEGERVAIGEAVEAGDDPRFEVSSRRRRRRRA